MSILTGRKIPSEIYAEIRPILAELGPDLAGAVYSEKDTLKLSESMSHIMAAVSFWPEPRRFFSITLGGIADARDTALTSHSLSTALSVPLSWHTLSGNLSEQEIEADVITDLSAAYHTLFSKKVPAGFVIPASLLDSSLPDPRQYHESIIRLHIGTRLPLSDLIHRLVTAGYNRNAATNEPGTIVVRGESVTVWHPILPGKIHITFGGDKIESITLQQGQRSKALRHTELLPMKFPQKTVHWQEVLSTGIVICPPEVTARGLKTIIGNSSQATFTFPSGLAETLTQLFSQLQPVKTAAGSPISYERAMELIAQLIIGRPAVHTDHGIGVFEGLQSRNIEGIPRDYLVLRYAQGDALSVPVEYAHKVTAYVGQSQPTIHRLHGTAWKRTKQKAQHDAIALAKELLAIAGKRSAMTRAPYILEEKIEKELNESFPHRLTDDQVRTWQEVREDMQKDIPMDRLVVGDVGFGKTEIALRAARHAAAHGRQVLLLAPTTLLVQQHYDVFRQRLPQLVKNIHLLSRFTSPAAQTKSREAISDGSATIVIGTHAALSPKISWHNLTLLIIDEEQRFGVKQKEHLKKMRSTVDVLSLSATPIPRTLSMALSGLRALSIITTAPSARKAVKTSVGKLTNEKLQQAIEKELQRNGQVYIVTPKIRQLAALAHEVESLIPTARIAVGHGRLPDEDLARVIHSFDSGETNILISSSIVEHGLDLPGANTMIVMHAPHFGLSDLYQLRGRIGRRERQGYAHFFYTQQNLTSIQRRRLAALTEASRLGSGWELARRDLEIRGAGNLLGAQQSGSAEAVGVQLYLDMVRSASTTEEVAIAVQADVALPLPALLPVTYVSDSSERTKWYIRLSRAKTAEEVTTKSSELSKQYGPLPTEVQNFILILRLSRIAGAISITKITTQAITPSDEDPYVRLIIEATDAPRVLARLSSLGNWRVRGQALTWDTETITPTLVQKLITVLQ
ncbi:MAG: DEAD/DEAH box helicase [Candidatus Andersenbacteria bacterium]|nr:DEAD/DEAH box helicase [Candidatus Andersenbacteria bacterium]MBI3251012.1 DEAD/DEAH box helicase [Candidatus Andersenbacteria bacterium]